jgi:hypothetical protein
MSDSLSFIDKIMGIITSPKIIFKEIDENDLQKGLALVIIVSLLSAWAGMIYFSKTELDFSSLGGSSPMFQPGAQGSNEFNIDSIQSRMAPFIAIGAGLSALARWLVPSFLIIFVSNFLISEGSTRRLLAMTGFASIPRIIQQILRIVDAYTIKSADLASIIALNTLFDGLIGKIINQLLIIFNIFGILTVILTIFAVTANYNTTTRKGASATLLAYAIYVLVRAYLPII